MTSFNMLSLEHVVVTVLTIFLFVSRTLCQVTLNVPEYAMQGDAATLECRISPFLPSIDSAKVIRNTGTAQAPIIRTLATHNGRHPNAPSNVDVKMPVLTDGTCRLIVTVSNVQREDAAVYTCSASRQNPTGYLPLGSKSAYLAILYLPSDDYPSCSTIPPSASLQKQVGDVLEIACTSELGNPNVNLIWGRTGAGHMPNPIEFVTPTTFRSELSITLSATDNGAQFVCISKSAAFSDYAESCLIGPIILTIPQSIEPPTQSTNTSVTSEWQTETNNNSGNSSFSGFTLDIQSPIVIGAIAGGGVLILLILVTALVLCLVRCCQPDRKKQPNDDSELKEINLVMTDNISKSKDSISETDAKLSSSNLQEYTTSGGKTQESCMIVDVAKEDIKPKAPSSSAPKVKVKEYPPPPDYPRPAKGHSTKLTNRNSVRDSQNVPEVVVYGNLNTVITDDTTKSLNNESSAGLNSNSTDSQQKETELVAYGNFTSIRKKSPHSTPTPTKRTEDNGSPLLSKKQSDGIAYGNLNSLTRRSTRSSPTPNRPNKAPPPPPAEQGDATSAAQSNNIETDLTIYCKMTVCTNASNDISTSKGSTDDLTIS